MPEIAEFLSPTPSPRPDHVPTVGGESNEQAGYSFGQQYTIGYIRGLRQAVYA
jgi:mannonate dehydratase